MRRRLVAALALPAVWCVLLAWPDEDPLPETLAILALLDPVSSSGSWFYGAFGFGSGGDIFAAGERRVASLRENGADSAAAERPVSQGAVLLRDYLALYAATDFRHVLPPSYDVPLPDFGAILAAQRALHEAIAAEQDSAAAVRKLADDLHHWRRVLAGTNVMVSKMAAVRAVERALELRARLIERWGPPAVGESPPALMPAELDMSEAIRFEMGIDYSVVHDLESYIRNHREAHRPGLYAWLPYKPVATFNRHQQDYAPILALSRLPPAQYAREYETLPPRLHAVTWWDRIVNGRGIWILDLADASTVYGQYISEAHALDARIAQANPRR